MPAPNTDNYYPVWCSDQIMPCFDANYKAALLFIAKENQFIFW